jgi:hypothetical protein
MRRSVCAIALAAALVSVCCHGSKNHALLGKWISVARAKDATATVTEFRPNGTFSSAFQTTLECSYRLNGDLMILSVNNPQTGRKSEDSAQVRVIGDTLYLKSPLRDTEEPMQRLSSHQLAGSAIVGSWGSGINGPRPAVADFTGDGKMTFRQTLRTVSGTYSASGDTLSLTFEGTPRQTGKFRFENGALVLTPEKGEEQRLTRIE